MEKTLLLKAEVRTKTGTKAAAKIRKQGRVPATVYGHKQTPTSLSLDAHEFVQGLHLGQLSLQLIALRLQGSHALLQAGGIPLDRLARVIIGNPAGFGGDGFRQTCGPGAGQVIVALPLQVFLVGAVEILASLRHQRQDTPGEGGDEVAVVADEYKRA
ncbi:MAG: hypothetical protein IIA65_01100 [Planctomycetes bacterium]|nr:hypothetical protein [Planctomycetota bacterium]